MDHWPTASGLCNGSRGWVYSLSIVVNVRHHVSGEMALDGNVKHWENIK